MLVVELFTSLSSPNTMAAKKDMMRPDLSTTKDVASSKNDTNGMPVVPYLAPEKDKKKEDASMTST